MTKFTSLFRQHSRPSDDSLSSSPKLVASDRSSSEAGIEGDRLYEIFTPANGHGIQIDIVAVHGLMGNPYTRELVGVVKAEAKQREREAETFAIYLP